MPPRHQGESVTAAVGPAHVGGVTRCVAVHVNGSCVVASNDDLDRDAA